MNRFEFVIATTIILLVTFGLGWFMHWLLHRLSRNAGADLTEMDQLSQSLHDAEEMRDLALHQLENREAELQNQINQIEAELRAAMDGLREARQEAAEMRAYIEKMHANS